ncbi:MAG: hypothetical protein DRP66_11140 [Planctomycetota bacterium]|nr:MAG: hypothetical protein DRP66_11140 [Planctomycetota bacterium]
MVRGMELLERLKKSSGLTSQNFYYNGVRIKRSAVEALDRMRLADAQKEYAATSRISFGIDGDEQVRDADFEAIRGEPEDNDFIIEMQQRLANKKQTAADLTAGLRQLT